MRSVSAASSGVRVSRSSPCARTCVRVASATVRCARCSTSRTPIPRSAIASERREDEVDHGRCETERRLVEKEDRRPRDERAGDRELLLLTARERPRVPMAELVHDREELPDLRDRVVGAVCTGSSGETEPQVLLDGELGEQPPPLRDESDPTSGDRFRGAPAKRALPRRTSPPRAGTSPMIACSVVDLPAPFGPMSPTISPDATSSDTPRTAATPPYADLEIANLERHSSLPPTPRGTRRRRRGSRGSRSASPPPASGPGRAPESDRRRP